MNETGSLEAGPIGPATWFKSQLSTDFLCPPGCVAKPRCALSPSPHQQSKESSTSLSKAKYIKDCDVPTYFGNKVVAVSQIDKISCKQNTGFF